MYPVDDSIHELSGLLVQYGGFVVSVDILFKMLHQLTLFHPLSFPQAILRLPLPQSSFSLLLGPYPVNALNHVKSVTPS